MSKAYSETTKIKVGIDRDGHHYIWIDGSPYIGTKDYVGDNVAKLIANLIDDLEEAVANYHEKASE